LIILYQVSTAEEQFGCFLLNSINRFRVIICTNRNYLIMRYLSIKKRRPCSGYPGRLLTGFALIPVNRILPGPFFSHL
jgi:hypothetical protein